jgi:hypothetical protein
MNPFRTIAGLAALAVAALTLPACASLVGPGNASTEERHVAGFHAIALSAPVDVQLVQDGTEGLTITGDDNVLPLIETKVENGVLKIRFVDHHANVTTHGDIKATVRAKSIDTIMVAGSGDVRTAALDAPHLKVLIGGSGDVRIAGLTTPALETHIGGSGDLTAAGKVGTFEVNIGGSGDVKAQHLRATSAEVTVAGSGTVGLWVDQSLKVKVLGSGDVSYYGDPSVQKQVTGSGGVKRLGASPS